MCLFPRSGYKRSPSFWFSPCVAPRQKNMAGTRCQWCHWFLPCRLVWNIIHLQWPRRFNCMKIKNEVFLQNEELHFMLTVVRLLLKGIRICFAAYNLMLHKQYLTAVFQKWMWRLVLPCTLLGQETVLAQVDVQTLQTTIPAKRCSRWTNTNLQWHTIRLGFIYHVQKF